MLFTGLGRSVLGKTVPEVSTAVGRQILDNVREEQRRVTGKGIKSFQGN